MDDRRTSGTMRRGALIAGLAVMLTRALRRRAGPGRGRDHHPEGDRAREPDRAGQRRRRHQPPVRRRAGGMHPLLPERRGRGRAVRRRPGTRFLDIRNKITSGGERGLLGLAFHPQLRDQRLLLRLLHERRQPDAARAQHRRHRDRALHRHRRPEHRRPRLRADPARHPALVGQQPQRRPAGLRSRRLPVRGGGRRRRRRRSLRDRPEHQHDAGQDPPHRRERAPTRPSTASRRPTRSSPAGPAPAADRQLRRDLGLRPAQPVALQLRPPDRRPLHRRRRPGRVGGDRLPARGRRGRPQLRVGRAGGRPARRGAGPERQLPRERPRRLLRGVPQRRLHAARSSSTTATPGPPSSAATSTAGWCRARSGRARTSSPTSAAGGCGAAFRDGGGNWQMQQMFTGLGFITSFGEDERGQPVLPRAAARCTRSSPWSVVAFPPRLDLAPFIERLYAAGVTAGCGGADGYCAAAPTTREQVGGRWSCARATAAFVPPPCAAARFADVASASPFCPWIEELARRNVVAGCGGGRVLPARRR